MEEGARSRVAAIDDREARVAAFSALAGWLAGRDWDWDWERERPRTKARRGREWVPPRQNAAL